MSLLLNSCLLTKLLQVVDRSTRPTENSASTVEGSVAEIPDVDYIGEKKQKSWCLLLLSRCGFDCHYSK